MSQRHEGSIWSALKPKKKWMNSVMKTISNTVVANDRQSPRLSLIWRLLASLEAWRVRRRTAWELSRLDDRQLADIGVSRFELGKLARADDASVSLPPVMAAIGVPRQPANASHKADLAA